MSSLSSDMGKVLPLLKTVSGGSSGGDTTAPSAPTNLTASAASASQINLSWTASTDNVGVTGYRVFRGGTQVGTPTGTSYSDTGLTASTAYSYTVKAIDAAGNISANSNTASATTQAGTPAPTVAISANPTSVSSGGSSALTWSSTNATSCTASGGWSGTKATSGSQTLTATATYTLTCTGTGGSANNSATITVTTAGGGGSYSIFTTQTPALLNVSEGSNVNYELGTKFQTNTAGQITAIRFYKASQESGTHTGHIWSSTGSLLATVTFAGESASGWQTQNLTSPLSIAANTTYTVSVNTRNTYYVATNNGLTSSIANGPLSTVVGNNGTYGSAGAYPTNTWQASNYFRDVVFTSGSSADTTPPSAPTNLAATAISISQINLTWTASTDNVGVTGYRVFRGGVQVGTPSGTSYSDTGLTASTAYSYYVRAVDAAGNVSGNSNTASATTQAAPDAQAPSVPTNLSASAISSSQITLSWTTSTDNVGVTGYKIFRGGTQIGTSATASYSDSGLSPATAYSYTVSAYDAAGNNSAQSTSASATTLSLPPTAVISAAPQSIGSGDSSTLSWSSTNATACTGTNFSTGGATSGSTVVSPSATTVYTVSCTGSGGTGTNNVTVTVGALSALPTISFPSGTFTWTTTDAVSCTASGGWTGSVGTSGSYTFSTPQSTTYVLTCTGGGTTVQRTITITTSETATVSSKFQSGQNVTTTSTVNVRSTPSTSGTLLGTQSTGAHGTVTRGPVQANGYWWWQVDFASGPDGWSVENWLQ